jgi:hypothetical protein
VSGLPERGRGASDRLYPVLSAFQAGLKGKKKVSAIPSHETVSPQAKLR